MARPFFILNNTFNNVFVMARAETAIHGYPAETF
jgi:hypothetical protein